MLFSEVYGSYFNAVAAVLEAAVAGTLTHRELEEIVCREAFAESVLTIPRALLDESWPLLTAELKTPLRHAPTMPLTTLQKRWLRSLLDDPRIRLFSPSARGLEDVEPLFSADTFVYFDRYTDGDPFTDEDYIANFRIILTALREKRKLRIRYKGHEGDRYTRVCVPRKLEYSAKDDKFRLLAVSPRHSHIINLGRVSYCRLLEPYGPGEDALHPPRQEQLILELADERNALERAMLHFSHLAKETERLDEKHYRIKLSYDKKDETELLIRVLAFGPLLKVTAPPHFREKLWERIEKQKSCGL